ncbi:HDOD domain-containing protein [Methylomonas sp. SURF-1]|uniref:HDOD domain-containing protein n=1 Tax=Methylomonas aurea TaxID=2952224 RepID=A0ABT1UDX6_9GAMM|nr:HDOD domain-containing protein [Methylomonas sp. SURF-1]MCQ8180048.1 HDOD domain-containing protein [Methylomonas sp. SURF-1]
MNGNAQSIPLQVGSLKNLPALPEASMRILAAVNTPDISIDKLTSILALSPGLVARLLGLANSAYFARGAVVSDLRTAIFQVLGLDLVKSLALGIVLNVQFDTSKCQQFDSERFWSESLLTAVSAQKLAVGRRQLQGFSSSTVYTGGLLLNIGMLALAFLLPDQLNSILVKCSASGLAVGEEIARQLGHSHHQLGYVLLNKWQLPTVYQSLLFNYGQLDFVGHERALLVLLRLSRQLSSNICSGTAIGQDVVDVACHELELSTEAIEKVIEWLGQNKQAVDSLAGIMGER